MSETRKIAEQMEYLEGALSGTAFHSEERYEMIEKMAQLQKQYVASLGVDTSSFS